MISRRVVLEQAAQDFADATAERPYIYELPPEQARDVLEKLQSGPGVPRPDIDEEWIQVRGGPTGVVPVRVVRPRGVTETLPVILYLHGGGWVLGSAHTHDRLVRELAVGCRAAVVFPEYDRAPEARYPTQLDQIYAAAQWVMEHGGEKRLDPTRTAVCGDSVGGNMATVLAMMARERGDVRLRGQCMFYPVTDAALDTESYKQFATGYYLHRDGMKWFWDQYASDPSRRTQSHASPLRARTEELRGLPPALIVTGEADVLRDEGEMYAARLRELGNDVTAVRMAGMVHDFVMIDRLRDTNSCRAAMELATTTLRRWIAP
ncbi:alpha/beta hydrolase fold domain-containing protein [Nonomuraea phyllanthi]|uniref:Alpha/beta hydrolase fold domain-containing protein n=1 Tax=Nonomuraea phyllanthi TaxID=2219224 RepID=A0A5C4WQ72_9ACTN|nr:alpha/beta hydrolase [Nonomuraea phyllanthi]KAB8195537.1 alpha/beta hydrolase fold domain-containing protein [Nonomuraea phyllanthi]QFY14618.1 alpha/beta hydrolase fold domain-containing protein [Nonomuraea phyllanthi]